MLNKRAIITVILILLVQLVWAQNAVRVKDIARVRGVRQNQLSGFGLVTGLNGKGDSSRSQLLKKVLSNLVSSWDISIPREEIRAKNCAVVMVTATIPSFIRSGDSISVTISSISDATSLEGGVLLQTNLRASNKDVYAVAQGVLATATGQRANKTVGTIKNGAIVERDVVSSFADDQKVSILLDFPDFTTAKKMADAIGEAFADSNVRALDAHLVEASIPEEYLEDAVGFIARIEGLTIVPDYEGRIVINQRSGVIVIGKNVRVAPVAVSCRGARIVIGNDMFSDEDTTEQFYIPEKASVEDLVTMLQELGLETDLIIDILKAVHDAGALYGRLTIM